MAAHPPLSKTILADWRLFQGPIHLSAVGSALLACAVHRGLFLRCADGCADGGLAAAHAQRRHARFCERLVDELRHEPSEPPQPKQLNQLEADLYADADAELNATAAATDGAGSVNAG